MASLTTDIHQTGPKPGFLSRLTAALARGIDRHGRRVSRRAEIEALEAKSDAELAAMGLRRENIPQYVFRDLFYI